MGAKGKIKNLRPQAATFPTTPIIPVNPRHPRFKSFFPHNFLFTPKQYTPI